MEQLAVQETLSKDNLNSFVEKLPRKDQKVLETLVF